MPTTHRYAAQTAARMKRAGWWLASSGASGREWRRSGAWPGTLLKHTPERAPRKMIKSVSAREMDICDGHVGCGSTTRHRSCWSQDLSSHAKAPLSTCAFNRLACIPWLIRDWMATRLIRVRNTFLPYPQVSRRHKHCGLTRTDDDGCLRVVSAGWRQD